MEAEKKNNNNNYHIKGSRKACPEHPGERREVRAEPGALPYLRWGNRWRARTSPPSGEFCDGDARPSLQKRRGLARTGAPEHRPKVFPPPAGSALLTLRAAGRWRWKLATWKRGSFPTRIPT